MSNTPILDLPVAPSLDGSEWSPLVQGGTTKRATTQQIGLAGLASVLPGSIEFLIDGGGGVITQQTWGYMTVPFNAALTSASMLADTSGSIIVNVWKCQYGQFDAGVTHPVAADSITSSTPPTITTATKYSDALLSNWITTLTQGDVLAFNVPIHATNITRVTLSLNLTRVLS